MAALCDRGVCFSQAIAAATYTTASVFSMLTGMYPAAHGIRLLGDHRAGADCPTLGSILSDVGYTTYAHVTGPLLQNVGFGKGFRHFHYRDTLQRTAGDWSGQFLRAFRAGLEEPWFMLVHLWALHHPHQVPPRFDNDEWGQSGYERALSGIDHFIGELLSAVDSDRTITVLTSDHGERQENESRAAPARWLRGTGRLLLDRSGPVGRAANWLKGSRLIPNALLRVGARHGSDAADVLARIPLAIAAPGALPAGVVVPEQVRTIDLAPTLIELLGVDASPVRFQGESLLPLARGIAGRPRPALIEAYSYARRSTAALDSSGIIVGLRTPEWKLVFRPHARVAQEQLYDLVADPLERHNAVRRSPGVARELRALADELLSNSSLGPHGEAVIAGS